jgi:hypothetical protein
MTSTKAPRRENIALSKLRPTQLTVGMMQVKFKRKQLRALERKPGELVGFILENPIRVVLGPHERAYVIDHHHLGLALIKEHFETAPMEIEEDFSGLSVADFWKKMGARKFLHLVSASGKRKDLDALPKDLRKLQNDPYRSLAGFVRAAGGYMKVKTPFAEFKWADFYRMRISKKLVRSHFHKALARAIGMASNIDAAGLPGYMVRRPK